MSNIAELVPLMTPEERKDARELDSRADSVYEVDLYWKEGDNSLRVEVLPRNWEELPFGLIVRETAEVKEVYLHPYSHVGNVALRAAWEDTANQAA